MSASECKERANERKLRNEQRLKMPVNIVTAPGNQLTNLKTLSPEQREYLAKIRESRANFRPANSNFLDSKVNIFIYSWTYSSLKRFVCSKSIKELLDNSCHLWFPRWSSKKTSRTRTENQICLAWCPTTICNCSAKRKLRPPKGSKTNSRTCLWERA